ncbi:MAG TPA: hypothetical protein GX506_00215 [Firmicutes bacterium]|nr:hypothetical protein [Bacillota bacterium]
MRRFLKGRGPGRGRGLWVMLIVISIVFSGVVIARRARIEGQNRTVELVMDFDSARTLCMENGYDLGDFISEMKSAGIASFALTELTLKDLADRGHVAVMSGAEIIAARRLGGIAGPLSGKLGRNGQIDPARTYIMPLDLIGESEIKDVLPRRLPEKLIRARQADSLTVVEVAQDKDMLLKLNMGMPRDYMALLKTKGLGIVPRFMNFKGAKPEIAAYFLERTEEFGPIDAVLFDGTEVLGYPDHMAEIAGELKKHGLSFGRIEFSKQLGEQQFARYMTPGRVIRVHSITHNEISKFTPPKARERFIRAARERGMRILYIRPLVAFDNGEDPIRGNIDYVRSLASALEREGFTLGKARPYQDFDVATTILAVIAAGALAGGILLLVELYTISPCTAVALFIAGLLAFTGLSAAGARVFARQLVALGAAVVYPSLGAIHVSRTWTRRPLYLPAPQALLRAGFTWMAACLITGAGAIIVAGILSAPGFMIQLDQFAGVKLMHILPPLVVAYFMWRHWQALQGAQLRGDQNGDFVVPAPSLGSLLARPLLIWHVLAGMLVLLAGIIYIGRTGNTFGIPISGMEETVRVALEKVFSVRPRTKEFLLGHPAMILGAVLVLAGGPEERRWAPFFLIVGTIGQLSFVNSFSHIHTPVVMTALRTLWGGLLGLVLGTFLSALYLWGVRPYLARFSGVERSGMRDSRVDRGSIIDG